MVKPMLPILERHSFTLVLSTVNGTIGKVSTADLRLAVRGALIAALPPGTGVHDVSWTTEGMYDVYKKESERA